MSSEPLVSVVTPVYNTGEYLEQAIQSVLGQTYQNFEYVICNNHSSDRTGEIAEKYARLDSRIRVIRPPRFLPQALNFNYVLDHISPESSYCKMILGDDKLLPNCLKEMVALAEANPSVAIVSSYRLIETEGACFGLPLDQSVISGRVAGRLHLLHGIFLFGTPSTVMYRSAIVRARNPKFYPEDRSYYDTDAAFQILMDHDFGFVHQVLSYSRYQPDSITHRERDWHSREIDRIVCVNSYGREYLDSAEFERCVKHAERVYYERLGLEWVKQRLCKPRPDFWEWHEKRLRNVGLQIDKKRLMYGAARAVGITLLEPANLLREVVRKRRPVEDPWRA